MVGLIAKRYGTALFELAVESDKIAAIEEEVIAVKQTLVEQNEIINIMNHPKITTDDTVKMVEDIYKGKISEELMGLIVLLVKKKRQTYMVDVFDAFLQLVKEHNNLVIANVTSVKELTDTQKDELVSNLKKTLNKDIEVKVNVDKSIIGGLIIRIGDKIIDNSIKGKMKRLSSELAKIQLS